MNIYQLIGHISIKKIECSVDVFDFRIPTEYFSSFTELEADEIISKKFMSSEYDCQTSMTIDFTQPTIAFKDIQSNHRLALYFNDIQTRNSFVFNNFTYKVTKVESIDLSGGL